MTRTRSIAFSFALATLMLSGCGHSRAERRAAMDAEWAITNTRSDEIHAEFNERIKLAETPDEKDAVFQWRMDELSKNFADHRARTGELFADWRGD